MFREDRKFRKGLTGSLFALYYKETWARSSVVRAVALYAISRKFNSYRAYQKGEIMRHRSVLHEIQEWVINVRSPRNDGWTKRHYQTKLDEVYNYLKKALEKEDEKTE